MILVYGIKVLEKCLQTKSEISSAQLAVKMFSTSVTRICVLIFLFSTYYVKVSTNKSVSHDYMKK